MFTEYCVDPTQPVHYSSHGVELAHFPVAKQNEYTADLRFSTLILISSQRHHVISFPSWQIQSAVGTVYVPPSLLAAFHTPRAVC